MTLSLFCSLSGDLFLSFFILSSLLYNVFVFHDVRNNRVLLDLQAHYQSVFALFVCFIIFSGTHCFTLSTSSLLLVDYSSVFAKQGVVLSSILSLILGRVYVARAQLNYFEYYTLILLGVFSIFCLLSSFDFLTLYISLEMLSLCLYVLAAFKKDSSFSIEGGLKYFILGCITSGIILFGCLIVYLTLGTTNLADISSMFVLEMEKPFVNFLLYWNDKTEKWNCTTADAVFDSVEACLQLFVGCFFIIFGFLFKLGVAPLHVWLPDVYEGSPFSSTLFFVMVTKTVYIFCVLRLCYCVFPNFFFFFSVIFTIAGVLSILIGSLLALKQTRVKRLLAYSSISHMGFILLGLASGSLFGVASVVHYLIIYILNNAVVWGSLLLIEKKYTHFSSPIYVTDFSNFLKQEPVLAYTLIAGFFSLAGIPPLSGFFMKLFIFMGAFSSSLFEYSTIILFLSIIGSFYYLRVLKIIGFEFKETKKFLYVKSFGGEELDVSYDFSSLVISFSTFFLLFSLLCPQIFMLLSYKFALLF